MTDASSTMDYEGQPWEQQPEEPMLWYGRFDAYRAMGASRSVRSVYAAELASQGKPPSKNGSVPGAWKDASKRWCWPDRADAWDRAQLEAQQQAERDAYRAKLQAEQTAVLEQGQQQRELAKLAGDKLKTYLSMLNPAALTPGQAANLMRAVSALFSAAASDNAAALGLDALRRQFEQIDVDQGEGSDHA